MSEESAFEKSLSALSQFFVGDRTMLETLERVAEMATVALPAAAFVGLTLTSDGRARTAVFTHADAPQIDEAQYTSGDGPCLESSRTGEIYRIASTRTSDRWPEFCRACVEHGIESTLSLPLTVNGETSGAMNLYSREEHAFDGNAMETARLFAAQAAVVIANAGAYWSARARAEQLDQAMQSRAGIEQAKGIIISTMRCDADEAFDILVKQSQQQNRKLHEIASEIVQNASRRG